MDAVLITGGAGFIGSHLAEALSTRGITVRVFDNFSSGSKSRLDEICGKVEIVEGDIRDFDLCRTAARGVDIVFHLAAFVSVPRSVSDPILSSAINIDGTLNMLLAAQEAKVKRFVFSSSAAVYGNLSSEPLPETELPCPASPYGVQKLAGEQYARIFHSLHGLETVSLRYFNVYGPRQDANSEYAAVVPKFMKLLLAGQAPTIYGDGEQTRNFLSVSDIVRANILAATTDSPLAIGGVFNVAGEQSITLNELVATMQKATGARIEPQYGPSREGDILHSKADVRKARAILGFGQKVSLSDGLQALVEHYRRHNR